MVKQFEFIEQKKARSIAAGITPRDGKYSNAQALDIATRGDSEILIYGNYRYDASAQKLIINAFIYHKDGKKLIGTVREESEVNNRVFKRIDIIAEKIVDSIYRFALQSDREALKKDQKQLRVMILVPTWKSKKGRKKALKEFKDLKRHLAKKYDARFLTIFEFFKERKIKESEQKPVLGYAKQKDDKSIVKWLSRRGIQDAFIVFVAMKNVQITPVVQGSAQKKVKYKAGAPKAAREKAWAKVAAKSAGLKTKKQAAAEAQSFRVSLKKDIHKSEAADISGRRWLVTVTPGVLRPFGFLSRSFLTGIGTNFDASYKLLPTFETGVKLGFYYFLQRQSNRDKVLLFVVQPYMGLPFKLGSSFATRPYLALGIDAGSYIGLVDSDFFLLPSAEIGNRFDYILSSSMLISLDTAFHAHYDKKLIKFARLGLGMALRL